MNVGFNSVNFNFWFYLIRCLYRLVFNWQFLSVISNWLKYVFILGTNKFFFCFGWSIRIAFIYLSDIWVFKFLKKTNMPGIPRFPFFLYFLVQFYLFISFQYIQNLQSLRNIIKLDRLIDIFIKQRFHSDAYFTVSFSRNSIIVRKFLVISNR